MLLPLQGVWGVWVPFTQGAALGYVLLPLRGVLFMSFAHPPLRLQKEYRFLCRYEISLYICNVNNTSSCLFTQYVL